MRYGVVYADPPWSFRSWSAKGTGSAAVSHYDCLSFEELASFLLQSLPLMIARYSFGQPIRSCRKHSILSGRGASSTRR
jgi:hypothetical protein